MCGSCQEIGANYILDLVNKGYDLELAIRIVRDTFVGQGLMDRGAAGVDTIEDIQALFDDVTAAGEKLSELRQATPYAFQIMCWGRTETSP